MKENKIRAQKITKKVKKKKCQSDKHIAGTKAVAKRNLSNKTMIGIAVQVSRLYNQRKRVKATDLDH